MVKSVRKHTGFYFRINFNNSMFETPITNSGPEEKESLDEAWYDRFEKIGAFQAYEYLDGDKDVRDKGRNAFLLGEKI